MARVLVFICLAGVLAACSFARKVPLTQDTIGDDPGVQGPYRIELLSGDVIKADGIEAAGDSLLVLEFSGSSTPFGEEVVPDTTTVARIAWSDVKAITGKKYSAGGQAAEGVTVVFLAAVVFFAVVIGIWLAQGGSLY